MRLILFFLLFFFQINFISAQVIIEWQKTFGGSQDDSFGDIIQDSYGNLIAIGGSMSNNFDIPANHGNSDIIVTKMDDKGNVVWTKNYGGTEHDFGGTIMFAPDGSYIISGWVKSNNIDISGNRGGYDIWVANLDTSGTIIWQKCYGTTQTDYPGNIISVPGGYVFIASVTHNSGDVTNYNSTWLRQAWVVKIDYSGNIIWQKCINTPDDDVVSKINSISSGGFLLSIAKGSGGCQGDVDAVIMKLNDQGNLVQTYCKGGPEGDTADDAIQTIDGNIVFLGVAGANGGHVVGHHGGYHDIWLVKQNAAGTILWQKCLGGIETDLPISLFEDTNGSLYVLGQTYSSDGDVDILRGINDAWLLKFNSAGNIIYKQTIGGYSSDQASRMLKVSENEILIVGSSKSDDMFVTRNKGEKDAWIIKVRENYSQITGNLFIDLDNNFNWDAGENPLPYHKIDLLNSNIHGYSSSNGSYFIIAADTGSFIYRPNLLGYYNQIPTQRTSVFVQGNSTDSLNDFAFQPLGSFNDLCVSISPVSPFRSDSEASYSLAYKNQGTTLISNVMVVLKLDSKLTYLSSDNLPFIINSDSIVWNLGLLNPWDHGKIAVRVLLDPALPIGTLINSTVQIIPEIGDFNPSCNNAAWELNTTGSFDPNDIIVDRTTLYQNEISNPPFLNYIIRFQNTGNDTAFFVSIENKLPDKLDLNTFEFIDSSHPASIHYVNHSGWMNYKFENILLPDSNINEPESHGFISYRIKPFANLSIGDSINNKANIVFDKNMPIVTNTATTIFSQLLNVNHTSQKMDELMIYPNPARHRINLQGITESGVLEVYDMSGRNVLSIQVSAQNGDKELELPELQTGLYLLRFVNKNTSLSAKILIE